MRYDEHLDEVYYEDEVEFATPAEERAFWAAQYPRYQRDAELAEGALCSALYYHGAGSPEHKAALAAAKNAKLAVMICRERAEGIEDMYLRHLRNIGRI